MNLAERFRWNDRLGIKNNSFRSDNQTSFALYQKLSKNLGKNQSRNQQMNKSYTSIIELQMN